jgi:hypothetical protein
MKINPFQQAQTRGSVLAAVLVVVMLLSLTMVFVINQTQTQSRLAARSEAWNNGIALAEAGIEEGIAHCQVNHSNLLSQGWNYSNQTFQRSRQFGSDMVHISIRTNPAPGFRMTNEITAAGCVLLPWAETFVCRTVKVEVVRTVFPALAVLARNRVSMNGNPSYIDSYDSRDPAKSTGGRYDPAKRQARADVGCVSGRFDLGNGDVYGRLIQGPGVTGFSIGPNGVVGEMLWHLTGQKGVQPGTSILDPTLSAPDVEAPYDSALAPPAMTLAGTNYTAVLDDGDYQSATLSGKVLVRGSARLYVTGNVTITGGNHLLMAPGAKLRLYVAGANVNIQNLLMTPGTGSALAVLGLPGVNNVSVDTGPGSPCFIYAPGANFSMSGNSQFYGAVACDRFSTGGSPAFHYDEALSAYVGLPLFDIVSWSEP